MLQFSQRQRERVQVKLAGVNRLHKLKPWDQPEDKPAASSCWSRLHLQCHSCRDFSSSWGTNQSTHVSPFTGSTLSLRSHSDGLCQVQWFMRQGGTLALCSNQSPWKGLARAVAQVQSFPCWDLVHQMLVVGSLCWPAACGREKLSKKSIADVNPTARMKRYMIHNSAAWEQDSKHETGQSSYSFQAKTRPCCSSMPGSQPHKKWRQLTYARLSSYPDRLFSKTFTAAVLTKCRRAHSDTSEHEDEWDENFKQINAFPSAPWDSSAPDAHSSHSLSSSHQSALCWA